jgi:hypothetical protein
VLDCWAAALAVVQRWGCCSVGDGRGEAGWYVACVALAAAERLLLGAAAMALRQAQAAALFAVLVRS